jgi:hypothetical protein
VQITKKIPLMQMNMLQLVLQDLFGLHTAPSSGNFHLGWGTGTATAPTGFGCFVQAFALGMLFEFVFLMNSRVALRAKIGHA